MKTKGRKACVPEASCNSFARRSPMLLFLRFLGCRTSWTGSAQNGYSTTSEGAGSELFREGRCGVATHKTMCSTGACKSSPSVWLAR